MILAEGNPFSYDFIAGVRQDCPKIKLAGRLFDQWETYKLEDPVAAGRGWADRQYAIPTFRDLIDYPEWLNEVFGYTNPDRWDWMDQAQAAYICRWNELDPTKIPIVGNCGSGNLSGSDWVMYFPRTVKKARLFGFHGYGWPTIASDAPDQFLRYREIMGEIREANPNALGVITEMGITHMVVPGNPDRGYLDFMSPEEFWSGGGNLKWANDRLLEDAYGITPGGYMLGGTVYQIGGSPIPPPEPDGWASFECLGTSIIDEMAAISPGTPAINIKEEPPVPEDDLTVVLANMWERQGVKVDVANPDGFFRHAVESARTDHVFIIPQPSADGNYTTDRAGYRIAYCFPPMYAKIGEWDQVKTGLPFA
ncbi:MAG: hypothetical protein HYY29_03720 [Chloroflexi bacterium]|nr:hypothetical protein [Chloroflexota bacterium]